MVGDHGAKARTMMPDAPVRLRTGIGYRNGRYHVVLKFNDTPAVWSEVTYPTEAEAEQIAANVITEMHTKFADLDIDTLTSEVDNTWQEDPA